MEEEENDLLQKLGADMLKERLEVKIRQYHGLITRDAAVHLLSLEEFGQKIRGATVLQAKAHYNPCTLRVRVERVFPPRKYEAAGREAMNQRVAFSDHTGGGTLVCYDESCAALSSEAVGGDMIEASPVRYRNDEFHLMHRGTLRVVQKGVRLPLQGSEGIGNFEGEVVEVIGDFPVRSGTLAASFSIRHGGETARVVVWDGVGICAQLFPGSKVAVENGVRRGGEIHVGSGGRLLFEGQARNAGKKILEIALDDEKREVEFSLEGGEKVRVGLAQACAMMGLSPLPQGVSEKTAFELKRNDFLGREMPKI